jgi:hypothetical protein
MEGRGKSIWLPAGVAIAIWLLLWISDYGVLVHSAKVGTGRDCSYFIGFSVIVKELNYIDRCQLLRKV